MKDTKKNLKKFSEYTPEELHAVSVRGGRASGVSRRERKALKEELVALLENGDTQERLCLSLIQKAADGDTYAFKAIRDTIGEREPEELVLSGKMTAEGVRKYLEENYLEELGRLAMDERERKANGEEPRYGRLTEDLCSYTMLNQYMRMYTD